MKIEGTTAYLPDLVGKGYAEFWHSKKRYRVVKGSRASKKSTTIALNIICRMMEKPLTNALVSNPTPKGGGLQLDFSTAYG